MLLKLLLSASLIAPPPAPARAPASSAAVEPPTFFTPSGWLHGVWSDGDGVLAVHEYGVVVAGDRDGARRLTGKSWQAVERDRLRATAMPACPLPSGQQTITLDSLRPVPKASPPPDITRPPPPTSPPPPYPGTSQKQRSKPSIRLGFGGAFSPAATPPARVDSGFTLDLAVGAVIPVRKHVYLWPELGYEYTVRAARPGHFFTAGLAPMFGTEMAQAGLAPRLVVGDAFGLTGVGVRTGLVGSFAHNLLTLELGHQWLRVGDRDLHDGRFMLSINVVPLFAALAFFAFLGAVTRNPRRIFR